MLLVSMRTVFQLSQNRLKVSEYPDHRSLVRFNASRTILEAIIFKVILGSYSYHTHFPKFITTIDDVYHVESKICQVDHLHIYLSCRLFAVPETPRHNEGSQNDPRDSREISGMVMTIYLSWKGYLF